MLDSATVKRRVAAGYDGMADVYLEKLRPSRRQEMVDFIDEATAGLEHGARVLDLGCGAGQPYDEYLSGRFDVTGVDISRRQLALARGFVPDANFILGDIASLPFRNITFEAVIALYSIIHVPREEHAALFAHLYELLGQGRRVFLVFGTSEWVGKEANWIESGVEMYWSQYHADKECQLLEAAGFSILKTSAVVDPLGDGGAHLFVLAERSS